MSDATPPMATETSGRTFIVRLQAKMIDEQQLKTLAELIEQNAGEDSGITVVALDMSKVQIVPSLALGMLVQRSNKCKARKQKLILAAVLPNVRQIFSITRLDRVLEFADTVDAAIE